MESKHKKIKKTASKQKVPFNPYDPSFNLKEDAITLFIVIAACLIQCLAISAFYTPNHFLSAGVTGISMLVEYITGLPKFVILIALNIPIMLIGFKFVNLKFIIFSIISTICYAVFFEIPFVADFHITIEKYPEILSALIAPVFLGTSSAIVVKRGATLGGMDVVSVVLSRRFSVPMGTINIIFNLVIMIVLGFFYGFSAAAFSMLAAFISNTTFNYVTRGFNRNMTVFIISEKWDEIAPRLLSEMHRGVTYLHGEGAYTGKPRKVVYCIIRASELAKLKSIVKSFDHKALFAITETDEVVGRGFAAMN